MYTIVHTMTPESYAERKPNSDPPPNELKTCRYLSIGYDWFSTDGSNYICMHVGVNKRF